MSLVGAATLLIDPENYISTTNLKYPPLKFSVKNHLLQLHYYSIIRNAISG